MKSLCLLFCLVLEIFGATIEDKILRDVFGQWKQVYNKVYTSSLEENYRFDIFTTNYFSILNHNAQTSSTHLALNTFADLTSEEAVVILGNTLLRKNQGETHLFNDKDLPPSVDWRQKGAVTGIKNQGLCGSCWAFSATGALEALYFLNNGQLISFSEQNLVDCVTADRGCLGGDPSDAFLYAAQSEGIDTEEDYPYKARGGKCEYNVTLAYDVNSGYYNVTPQNSTQLKAAIAQQPVAACVQFNQPVFLFYKDGVIKDSCGDKINHCVLIVGYDTINGDEAFVVKNSFGEKWGVSGYVYISTDNSANDGNGVCGILAQPSIPY